MASSRLPLPARGQPIDVPFIYDIVDTVNSLANDIADSNTNSFSSIYSPGPDNGGESIAINLKTANIRITARFKNITGVTVASDSVTPFTIDFGPAYSAVPLVIMTLFNGGGQNFASAAVVTTTSINNSQVAGQIYFPKGGTHTGLQVHAIAIGPGVSQ